MSTSSTDSARHGTVAGNVAAPTRGHKLLQYDSLEECAKRRSRMNIVGARGPRSQCIEQQSRVCSRIERQSRVRSRKHTTSQPGSGQRKGRPGSREEGRGSRGDLVATGGRGGRSDPSLLPGLPYPWCLLPRALFATYGKALIGGGLQQVNRILWRPQVQAQPSPH